MKCPRETALDRAAIRLQRAGAEPGATAPLPEGIRDLEPLLRHAAVCTRCREILGLLYGTEAARMQGVREPRILPLFPFTGGMGSSRGERRDFEVVDDFEPYLVAAETAGLAPPDGSEDGTSLVLTLATQDDRFVVRIFPNQDGPGATAVLLTADSASSEPGVTPTDGAAHKGEAALGVRLRVAGVEYSFNEKGYARLAEFPVEEVALLLD